MPLQHQKSGITADQVQIARQSVACILMRALKGGQIKAGEHQPNTSRQECLGAKPTIALALSLA